MKPRFLILILLLLPFLVHAGDKRNTKTNSTTMGVTWAKRALQGYNLKLWLSNLMTMGIEAWDPFTVPGNTCANPGIGMEYPAGSCVEHLYGAGPIIGGKINGLRHVSEAYNGNNARMEFLPERWDISRDKIWQTNMGREVLHSDGNGYSGYYYLHGIQVNRRGYDDDGDGKIDEDELDGRDNDGDWNPLTDDIGADGLPDSLEVSCTGQGYDPITNPDPAYDNYDPAAVDSCHFYQNGNYPLKNDKNKFSEHNGIPDHGEPHVDEDYGAVSDNDLYITATDTFKSYTVAAHFPMGLKIFQKTYAWMDQYANGFIPMDYYFVNIGRNTIDEVYIAFMVDFDVGPVSVQNYASHNYACYSGALHCGYIGNGIDSGATPAGFCLLGSSRPLDSLRYIWQIIGFNDIQLSQDSITYGEMTGEPYPGALIDACRDPFNPTDTRFFYSFGPFGTMKPGDTIRFSCAFVAGRWEYEMLDNAQRAHDLYNHNYNVDYNQTPPTPASFALSQNYPNPFNPKTRITVDIPRLSHVVVTLYDLLGREVRKVADKIREPGSYMIDIDASGLASGVYFYRVTARDFAQTKKMVLLR